MADHSSYRFLGDDWRLVRSITTGKAMKPDILILEKEGRSLVAKDFRGRNRFVRWIWGPLNLAYEKFILGKLDGVEGIPRVIGLEDYNCLLLSRIDGDEIKKRSANLNGDFFPRLFAIAARLHERGVVHLDLGHKSNVMVDRAGNPGIIDFNISLYLPPNRFFKPLIRLLARIDNYSILRLKVKYRPQEASAKEKRQVKNFLRLRKLWIFDRLVRNLTNLSKNKNRPAPGPSETGKRNA